MGVDKLPELFHQHLLPNNKPNPLVPATFKCVNDVTFRQCYVTIS